MTAMAIGERNSPPAPNASALGIIPAIMAIVVMMIGRARFWPASCQQIGGCPPTGFFRNRRKRPSFRCGRAFSARKRLQQQADQGCAADERGRVVEKAGRGERDKG